VVLHSHHVHPERWVCCRRRLARRTATTSPTCARSHLHTRHRPHCPRQRPSVDTTAAAVTAAEAHRSRAGQRRATISQSPFLLISRAAVTRTHLDPARPATPRAASCSRRPACASVITGLAGTAADGNGRAPRHVGGVRGDDGGCIRDDGLDTMGLVGAQGGCVNCRQEGWLASCLQVVVFPLRDGFRVDADCHCAARDY
jgi:hypothetical protein